MNISRRLQKIADYIPARCRMADIGSDHALLPIYLVQEKNISFAVAGELNAGPYQAARDNVEKAGLSDKIQVRQGDGLSVVKAGEVDAVVIAGMGGKLICRILDEGKNKLESAQHLILQPNVGESFVREWLRQHRWFLQDEALLEEDGHFYEILFASKLPDATELNEQLYREWKHRCGLVITHSMMIKVGPYLLRNPSAVLLKKWMRELEKCKRIDQQLEQASQEQSRQKRMQLKEEMDELEAVIQCMQTAKL